MKHILYLFALRLTKLRSINWCQKDTNRTNKYANIYYLKYATKTTFEVDGVHRDLLPRRLGHQPHQLQLAVVALRAAHRQVEAVLPGQLPVGHRRPLVPDDQLGSHLVVARHRHVQRRLLGI